MANEVINTTTQLIGRKMFVYKQNYFPED